MKRLNNKGMTTMELLITFAIVASVVLALYVSIANLRSREIIASYKQSITTYKDLLTREIQNDLIMKKLTGATTYSNKIVFSFSNNVTKTLEINSVVGGKNSNSQACNNPSGNINDSIKYGGESHPLPAVGSSPITTTSGCQNVNNLRIDKDSSKTYFRVENNIVIIKITLYHPDLGDKYSINIIAPINYSR